MTKDWIYALTPEDYILNPYWIEPQQQRHLDEGVVRRRIERSGDEPRQEFVAPQGLRDLRRISATKIRSQQSGIDSDDFDTLPFSCIGRLFISSLLLTDNYALHANG